MQSANLKLDSLLVTEVTQALGGDQKANPRALDHNELLSVFGAGPSTDGAEVT
jgi:hypothetical protein